MTTTIQIYRKKTHNYPQLPTFVDKFSMKHTKHISFFVRQHRLSFNFQLLKIDSTNGEICVNIQKNSTILRKQDGGIYKLYLTIFVFKN